MSEHTGTIGKCNRVLRARGKEIERAWIRNREKHAAIRRISHCSADCCGWLEPLCWRLCWCLSTASISTTIWTKSTSCWPWTRPGAALRLPPEEIKALRVVRMAAPVATVLALLWMAWQLKQGKKYMLPLVLSAAFGALSVCSHVAIKYRDAGVSMLFWLVIGWAVLAMVYYIYQHEFFLGACACGMSVLALWFVRYGVSGRPETILILAAIAVVTAAAVWLKKNDGLLPGPKQVQFLPPKTNYTVLLVTCLASLAAVVIAMVAGGMVAYYLIFVMLAWLFALFVYYTVKLM